MKVICINNDNLIYAGQSYNSEIGLFSKPPLTLFKTYDVIIDECETGWYVDGKCKIYDDDGDYHWYNITRFKQLSVYRNEIIDKIL